jgi:plastocyanin
MRLVVGCGVLALGLIACSNTPTSANGSNPPPGGGGGGGASAAVSIADYSYTPATLTVKAGTTVTWSNNGSVGHTVTSDVSAFNSGTLSGPMGDGYGGMTAGASFAHTFSSAGTYGYHCAIHGVTMSGTITVTP